MILKSVRIENFKCIEDSNEFSIEQVTCLVGKNESGKTAILQAINKLNPIMADEEDFQDLGEYPRRKWSEYKERREESPDNVLTTTWELESEDAETIKDSFGSEVLQSDTFTVTKGYNNEPYFDFEVDEKKTVDFFLKNSELNVEERKKLKETNTVPELIGELESRESASDHESRLLEILKESFPDESLADAMIALLDSRLPKSLYFADYQKLPGEVSIDQLRSKEQTNQLGFSDRIFIALLDLAGTSPSEIAEMGKFEQLVAELEGVSNRISEEIFAYWSQNKHLEVEFRFDQGRPEDPPPFNKGFIFRTRIKNSRHRVSVNFDERSTGFVWFFSFLVWFSQVRKNYGENLIIMLDEPGLSLHARAQRDLLRYINEQLAPDFQVIYTSHSPFMIDPNNLLSARTVEDVISKEEVDDVVKEIILGTKVGDRVFSTDRDTLFPLQAALSYDLTQTLFIGKHTLLVEGPSDLLYLNWASRELQKEGREYLDSRWVITPVGGIDKVNSFLALFTGNKLHVAVLTDFHADQKKTVRNLKESELLRSGHVFSAEMYVDQDEADTEDMLGRSFYVSLVNKCYSLSKKLPVKKPKGADLPVRVLEEVENHFRTLPPEVPELSHLEPAAYLLENAGKLRSTLPDLEQAIERFEKLFHDLNLLLTE